ncbi:hypothetical protein X566_17745 [Afipia sp. P52-10]|nr:hypothetical protein X566_17745 [Afipia sp. P52-10]
MIVVCTFAAAGFMLADSIFGHELISVIGGTVIAGLAGLTIAIRNHVADPYKL